MYFWRMLLYKEREVDWEISWPSDPKGRRLKDDCPDSPLADMGMSSGNITDQPSITNGENRSYIHISGQFSH